MIRLDEFHTEIAQINGLTELHYFTLGLLHEIVLGQLVLDNTHGQAGSVDGNINIPQHIRQCSDMILMSVGDDETFYLVDVILQVGYIRNDQIDSQHIVLRERKTTVYNYNTVTILKSSNVHTDLLQASQRNDLQT